jgi:uncharacterized protein (TIGR02001 family)
MRNARVLTALGLLAAAGAANAGVSSTWTATNDYDFRGTTQSAKDPALQASLDYAHDSGWYAGAWASNVDFGTSDPDLELDVYTGFTKTFDSKFGYDVGAVYYSYHSNPDPGVDYVEVYAGVSYDWFKFKAFYSPTYGGDAAKDLAKIISGNDGVSAFYVQADAAVPLPANFSILAHAGYAWGDYWDHVAGDEQIDYSAGVGYTAGHFNLALKYVDTSTDAKVKDDVFNNESRVIFTVSTTFPWSDK